ncbi:MAG: betaine/proline/choline family ABC transporter ATP-binding protein [Mesorhizobium sp.]|nr:betaine/proline/choline family ABC transporter ATP-binding protein [Mesorhizobium sp.]
MNQDTPVISARAVWKLFGENSAQYLANMPPDRSAEKIAADGHIPAVRNVSLDVARGEMLVVMGLSGSGKSTLVRCLSRLQSCTSGRIEIDGQDITSLGQRDLIELRRSKMGMVFQSFGLLPHRTVLDNVAFPLEIRGRGRLARHERAAEMLRLVGLDGREDYFPHELSGGQQQRVGIARSLAVEPEIWFLDEPFSALDPLIRREMQDEFLRLRAMAGRTIVFITHDFDEALRLADRIAIMKDGAIEQCDTPDKLVMSPATDYVARFTQEVDRARVVSVGALARSATGEPLPGEPLSSRAKIRDLARRLVEDVRPAYPVADKDGRIVGALDRDEALEVLLGPKP